MKAHWIVAVIALALGSCGSTDKSSRSPQETPAPALPEACPATPVTQSPATLGEGGTQPDDAATCDPTGTSWTACHQHMHCGPEHAGAGICAGADCEVHTVYRRRKDGSAAAAVENLHEGTVGGNCEPADHDILVQARFVDFDADCAAGTPGNVTYCGSATGNNKADANHDGAVSCAESGVVGVSVRWCIQTACECRSGGSAESASQEFGEKEATRERGCPSS